MHPSPSEHQGTPCEHISAINAFNKHFKDTSNDINTLQISCKLSGNFGLGWHQHRKMLPNENRLDFIPNLLGLERQAEILKAGGKLW